MKKVSIFILALLLCGQIFAQHLETTLKIVGNKARIAVKAVGGDVSGFPSNFVFSVALPIANSATDINTPAILNAARLPTSLASIVNYTDATYKYFNLNYFSAPGSAVTFVDGTEYELLELSFANGMSASASVRLVSMTDGNPTAPVAGGLWLNYLEVTGTQFSFGDQLFYATAGSSNVESQMAAADYSAGFGSIATISLSLPVNILNFSGYKSGSKNTLRWTTASESNNKGFEILRSADGVNYSSIGFVGSLAGGGNSSSSLSYTFEDMNPAGKKQYYRLNQTDKDGQGRLSNIVIISGEKPFALSIGAIFPNPARSQVNILIDAPKKDEVTIVVMDIDGKVVKQKQANIETGSNTIPVDIANLTAGSYLVKLVCRSSDCVSAVAKFNKQ